VRLAGVLGRAVGRVRLGQAVCRVWADLRVAVERVQRAVAAGRVVVTQERPANLFLVVSAVVLRVLSVCRASCVRHQGLLRRCSGLQGYNLGYCCTP
jgi:hypothetical protein